MQHSSSDPGTEKWQRYKEWLIRETAASEYPADAETLQNAYNLGPFPPRDVTCCEARAWLTNPITPGALTGNRFNSWEEGLAFVERLYELGAVTVYAVNIDHRKDTFDAWEDSGPVTDSLRMDLPDAPEQRRALLNVAAAEASLYDGPVEVEDTGQQMIGFWWD